MGRRKGSGGQYSTPPETEIKLQELQAKYLEDKNDIPTKQEFFSLIRVYTRSLTLKEIKKKNIYLPPERVDEICTDATLSIFKQYKKDDWSIRLSFAGTIYWKIREAMYSSAKDEQTLSLNTKFTDDDRDSKEMMDIIGTNATKPWQEKVSSDDFPGSIDDNFLDSINVAYDEIEDIIDEAYDILPYSTFMKFIPWLVLRFRRPKTRNCYQTFDKTFLTNKEENAFDILYLEIRDRIASHL